MYAYFAHPIDQGNPAISRRAESIAETLAHAGVSVFRPGAGHRLPTGEHRAPLSDLHAVDRINVAAMEAADAVVAWLPPRIPTLGVPAEIEWSLHHNKPTLILTSPNLIVSSVQVRAWEARGALVVSLSSDLEIRWRERPGVLHELLGTRPNQDLPVLEVKRLSAAVEVAPEYAEDRFNYPAANTQPPILVSGEGRFMRGKYQGDAGIDLGVFNDEQLRPGEYRLLETRVRVAIPEGYFGWLTGRSSTWSKHRCDVRDSVIDSGWRGDLYLGVQNRSPHDVKFEAGTRLGQLVVLPTFAGPVIPVEKLPEHERGESGFGSSGEKEHA